MASEGLAPTPTPPLGMVSTADATLEGGNLAKYAILQKAGILVTQPDGSGCASPKDQKPEDSSEDDSLEGTYIRRVHSASNLYPPSAMRTAQGNLPPDRRTARKVSWAPDLPLRSSQSYLSDPDNGKPFDFQAFIDRARAQSQRRSTSGPRGQKAKSRRPSVAANIRFYSYYSDDACDDENASTRSLGTPSVELQDGDGSALAAPGVAYAVHSAPTSPVMSAVPALIRTSSPGSGGVGGGDGEDGDGDEDATFAAAPAAPPPRSPRFRVVSPGRSIEQEFPNLSLGGPAADRPAMNVRPVSMDSFPSVVSSAGAKDFDTLSVPDPMTPPMVPAPKPAPTRASVATAAGAFFAKPEPISVGTASSSPSRTAAGVEVGAGMGGITTTTTERRFVVQTTPPASSVSSAAAQQKASPLVRTSTRSRFSVRSVHPAVDEH